MRIGRGLLGCWGLLVALLGACSSGSGGDGSGGDDPGVATLEVGAGEVTVNSPLDRGDVGLACDADGFYLIWEDSDDVFFSRSLDGGVTWSAPLQLDNGPNEEDADDPRILVCGSRIFVYWKDSRTGSDDIYLNVSSDGGATWQPSEIRVSHSADAHSTDPDLCCDGDFVYAAWRDERNGAEEDIYMNRSTDGGLTWLADDIRVERDPNLGGNDSEDPSICCQGQTVVVVWEDKMLGGDEDVFMNRSTDGGDTWLAQDVRLDVTDANHVDVDSLQVGCCGSTIYVAWLDERRGVDIHDVYFNVSHDFGVTWLPQDRRIDTGAANKEDLRLCCDGAHVYLAWEDRRRDPEINIYLNASHDGGDTWFPAEVNVDGSVLSADEFAIHCDGELVVLVWEDTREDAEGDVYGTASFDGGTTWLQDAVRVDASAPPGGDDPDEHEVCISQDRVVFAWDADGRIQARSAAR